jgi:cytochrome P450
MTFMIAGHETTAVGLSWCLYLLAQPQHEAIQQKLFDEISTQFKDGNESVIDWDTLKQLPYLDGVIKETLRYHCSYEQAPLHAPDLPIPHCA